MSAMRVLLRSFPRVLQVMLAIALAVPLWSPAPAYAHDYSYWVAHAQAKVYPTDTPPSSRGWASGPNVALGLNAARDEFEGKQLVLRGPSHSLTNVWIAPSDLELRDPSGALVDTIPASEVETFKVHYVNVAQASLGYSRTGLEPDPLLPMTLANGNRLPASQRTVAANRNQPYYVLIHTPDSAEAGTYNGTLTVTSDGGDGQAVPDLIVPVSVTVYPVSISTQTLKTSFGLSWRWAGMANSDRGVFLGPGAQSATRVEETTSYYGDQMRGWMEYMSEHRISPSSMPPVWEGGSNAYPPDDSGRMIVKSAALTDFLGTGDATTFAGERYQFSSMLLPEQTIPSYTKNPFASSSETAKAKLYYQTAAAGVAPWKWKAYVFAIDEPSGSKRQFIEDYGALVHQNAPGVKFMLTTEPIRWNFRPLRNVDAYVQQLHFYYRFVDDWVEPLRKAGKEVWIYSTSSSYQGEFPLYLIDSPLPNSRAMGWFCYDTSAAGYLYFSINRWGSTTYRDPYTNTLSFLNSNGDGSLVYPGYYPALGLTVEGSPPVGSLRMEGLRDGLEDYEYIKLIEKEAGSAVAKYYVSKIIGAPKTVKIAGSPTFPAYPESTWQYESVRAQMLHRLSASTARVSISGANRYDTAVKVSQQAFSSAPTVVIATGENWPDALGGAALASAEGGPILLTGPTSLPSSVLYEIRRLGASKAIILGGPGAVGWGVQSALSAELGASSVTRLGGSSRVQTAELIARATVARLGTGYDGGVFVATAENFPDALAASPLASAKGWPILLAPSSGLASSTRSTIGSIGATKAIILGGTKVVTSATQSAVAGAVGGSGNVTRLSGSNRYSTGVAVANYGVNSAGLTYDKVAIATGENFPDALAGGVLQGRAGSVMLLTTGSSLDSAVSSVLGARAGTISTVRFLGGTSALGVGAREDAIQRLN